MGKNNQNGNNQQQPHFSGQRILANGLTHTEGLFYKLCIIFPAIITSLLLFLTDIEDVVPEKYGGTVAMLTTMLTTISAFFIKFNVGQRRDLANSISSPRSNTPNHSLNSSDALAVPHTSLDDIVNSLRK